MALSNARVTTRRPPCTCTEWICLSGAAVSEKIMEAAERDEQERAKREAREKEIRIADKRVSMFEAEPQPGDLASIILVVFSLTVVATVLFWLTKVS